MEKGWGRGWVVASVCAVAGCVGHTPEGASEEPGELSAAMTRERAAVEELPPDITWNGRFVAFAVERQHPARVLAASDSGGLFRTGDGGITWRHVDAFRPARMFDVKRSPRHRDLVVASAAGDGRAINGGGIWVSRDGGATWRKPPTSNPPPAITCNAQANAYAIAFAPDRDDVFVGNDCGLAVSRDNARTWSFVLPDPANPSQPVVSVLARAGGVVDVYGGIGFRRSTDAGASFGPPAPEIPASSELVVHALAGPEDARIVFVALINPMLFATQLFESDDGGVSWTDITAGAGFSGRSTRAPFVNISPSRDGNPQDLDLYFGNGVFLERQTCGPSAGAPTLCPGAFQFVFTAHSDPSEVAFDPISQCARYLATDGGVHLTDDCGASWPAPAARPPAGLDALQLYEVASQVHPDHTDLYFGTQDNGFWASGDGGITWPGAFGSEGLLFSLLHRTPSDADQTVTFSDLVLGVQRSSAHLEAVQPWTHPPVAFTGIPAIIEAGVYVEFGQPIDGPDQLWISTDSGATWSPVPGATVPPGQRSGRIFVSGPPEAPVLYQPLTTPVLVRITGARTEMAVVERADLGLDSIGQHCSFFCSPVFAVDPLDPDHLLAADEVAGAMKVSRDGRSWQVDTALTALVTSGSEFLFSTSRIGTQASALAFHPSRPGVELVGTDGNGIIASRDDGRSWRRLRGTGSIPEVTAFAFDERTDTVVVSSFGRGLWRLADLAPRHHQRPDEPPCPPPSPGKDEGDQ
jgi:photosystem II stability/assembly factor-like uncharacterized protein